MTSPRGIMAKVLYGNLEVIEFKLQSYYYVHFYTNTIEKGMKVLIPPSYKLSSATTVFLQEWLWHYITHEDWGSRIRNVSLMSDQNMTLNHLMVRLQLWGMWSTSSLPLLTGSLCPRMIIFVRVPSISQIELFNHLQYSKPFNCVQTINSNT